MDVCQENPGINIAQATRSLSEILSIYFNLYGLLGVCCDDDIFKLTASAQPINREVYVWTNFNSILQSLWEIVLYERDRYIRDCNIYEWRALVHMYM